MKKMNKIYEAPKAEMIELSVYKPFMQGSLASSSVGAAPGDSAASQDSGNLVP
jgi:hypothetical protein